jgi:hypothetical protein
MGGLDAGSRSRALGTWERLLGASRLIGLPGVLQELASPRPVVLDLARLELARLGKWPGSGRVWCTTRYGLSTRLFSLDGRCHPRAETYHSSSSFSRARPTYVLYSWHSLCCRSHMWRTYIQHATYFPGSFPDDNKNKHIQRPKSNKSKLVPSPPPPPHSPRS